MAPAYDVYAHNPSGKWTSRHQMSANGKRDQFTRADLVAVAESISLSRPEGMIDDDVVAGVEQWPVDAREAGVGK